MCWNEETSWITLTIGLIAVVVAFVYAPSLQVKAVALIWGFVLLMQYFDAIAWRKKGKSKFAATGAMIANVLQPIVVGLVLLSITRASSFNQSTSVLIMVCYIAYILYALRGQSYDTLVPANGCSHLRYKWWEDMSANTSTHAGMIYLVVLIALIFLLLQPTAFAGMQVAYIIITLIISSVIYTCGAASIWCWFAAFAPILTIAMWNYSVKGSVSG